ncbi:MAG: spore coat protein [Clostridia bacterium]|nr:spore coat protein [Clostridia bacterium]
MKQSKRDTSLSEKDALQDLLDQEKLLMNYYSIALIEGSCKPFRKEILKNYTAHAETQFQVFEQMLSRGYYKVQPANKMMLDENAEKFSKVQKQIAAN